MDRCSQQDANMEDIVAVANQIKRLFEISLRKLPDIKPTRPGIEYSTYSPGPYFELGHIWMLTIDQVEIEQRCRSTCSQQDEHIASDSSAGAGRIIFVVQGQELGATCYRYYRNENVSHVKKWLASERVVDRRI